MPPLRTIAIALSLLSLATTVACNSGRDAKLAAVDQRVVALEKRISASETAKREPEHHYQLQQVGPRTFRFDPATGQSCILLTSGADWKNPEVKRQGCDYQDAYHDFLNAGDSTVAAVSKTDCLFTGRLCDVARQQSGLKPTAAEPTVRHSAP